MYKSFNSIKTVILCGGTGTRLGRLTKIKPKPMINIGNQPILWHILKMYHKRGFNNFILALGHKSNFIINYFKKYDGKKKEGIKIKIINKEFNKLNSNEIGIKLAHTGQNTLTGGRLLRLKKLFNSKEKFMLTYGDGVSNININKLLSFHNKNNKVVTVTAVKPPARFGALKIKKNLVTDFKEKIQTDEGWINGGFFVFNYKIFDFIKNDSSILEQETMTKVVKKKQINAFKHNGFWQCVDTARDKKILEELIKKGKKKW